MLISYKLWVNFRPAGAQRRLDFNLSVLAFCDQFNRPCRMSKQQQSPVECVVSWRHSSDWMSEISVANGKKGPETKKRLWYAVRLLELKYLQIPQSPKNEKRFYQSYKEKLPQINIDLLYPQIEKRSSFSLLGLKIVPEFRGQNSTEGAI